MPRSLRRKKTDISAKTRSIVMERDGGACIFCRKKYHMEKATPYELEIKEIMHFIPRSAGGMGIPENAAVGCKYHHVMFDNGYQGLHEEMREIFENYLKEWYPGWNKEDLVYDKWKFLKVETPRET